MKMMKKQISVVLALMMIISLIVAAPVTASAESAEEMQTISYLPSDAQNGKNIKVIINDKNSDYYIFTMSATSDIRDGIPVYSVEIPAGIDPEVIQFRVFDGSEDIGTLTLNETQYSALKGKVITFEGKAYGEEAATTPTVKGKAANTIKVTAKTKTIKLKKLKKKGQSIKPLTVKNAKGKVTYKLLSVSAKIKKLTKINSKGVITVKRWKKAKKGTYSIKVKITAKGNLNFNSKSITKTVKLKIK